MLQSRVYARCFRRKWRIFIYAEANLSTQQSPPRQDARLSRAHGDKEWSPRAQTPPRERSEATDAVALLGSLVAVKQGPESVSEALSKQRRLRTRDEFQRVYAEGQRHDGRLMAAFLRQNELASHRLGVTASSKAIGKSVDRNRAKRLLRELFRRSAADLGRLKGTYDWVLNAKRALIASNEELRFREFRRIIEQVARNEQ
jgi:ribonuclease P protein component